MHDAQMTTVWAWEKTVVMLKQPAHFTSMKNELGDCTRRFSLWTRASDSAAGGGGPGPGGAGPGARRAVWRRGGGVEGESSVVVVVVIGAVVG